ncbi:MAG: GNAT family N-acetyltransferase [Spirochaetia bacterium]
MVEYRTDLPEDLPVVRELFAEYGQSLGIDLSFQGFDEELASLPGKYAPPHGAVIVARSEGTPCGCVALRRIDERTCEMKRLYVRPGCRGLRIGAELVTRIIEAAKDRGYEAMRLDTLPSMSSAVSLYRSFGFQEIQPYIYNPLPGALFMEKRLQQPSARPLSP